MMQPLLRHKYSRPLLVFVITGAVLFNVIFWKEKLAINTVLFTAFTILAIKILYTDALKNHLAKWLLLAVIGSLATVIIYNSYVSSLACVTANILLTAYCKYRHRSLVYATGSVMQSFLYFVPQFFSSVKQYLSQNRNSKTVFNKVRIAILPLLLLLVFFFIYQSSSKVFSGLTSKLADQLASWTQPIFSWIEPQRILFLLLGLFISGGLLYQYRSASFQEAEALKSDHLRREKSRLQHRKISTWQSFMQLLIGPHASGLLALKYEYKAGVLSLLVLNVLLVFVNATDIVYLWIGRQYEPGFEWANYVHEGAEMLVFSILMAMLVVLFFFRGNLNFFRSKKSLLAVAYIWLLQNAFLTASVCLRNYYYVTHMALTYKRIGLFVFTLLVFAGLVSVYLKIRYVKSTYYLIKLNTAISFTALVLAAFVQWDVVIARYNIAHRNKVPLDAAFLLTLSDHALPLLQQQRALFSNQLIQPQRNDDSQQESNIPITVLDDRINTFLQEQKNYTWLSWNWADARTKQELLKTTPLASN